MSHNRPRHGGFLPSRRRVWLESRAQGTGDGADTGSLAASYRRVQSSHSNDGGWEQEMALHHSTLLNLTL